MGGRIQAWSLLAILACLWGSTAGAATFTVTNLADDGSVGTLRYWLMHPAVNDGDVIKIPPGTYVLDPAKGQLTIKKSLTLEGAGFNLTVVDGGGASRVFHVSGNDGAGDVVLSSMTIQNGHSDSMGGGILFTGPAATLTVPGTLSIINCHVTNNQAKDAGGGIAVAPQGGALSVQYSVIANNQAGPGLGLGGGIHHAGKKLIITNTQINDNTAHLAGGGVHNSSSMLMVNSTIARNSAQGYGGGADNAALATFYHVTIAENTSPQGAGLSSSGAAALLTLRNSAIAKNGPGGNCVSGGAYFSQGYNLDDDATCVSGPYDLIADPLFDPKGLANNGGLTETYALLPGSPAIDAADVLSGMIGIAGDQRGYVRSVDGNGDGVAGADIGAYEATAPSASWYPICGNGNGEFPEECDDANTVSGDGCSGICQLEAPAPSGGGTVLEQTPMVQIKPEAVLKLLPICGNGKVEGFEECDHGANNGKPGDTCNAQCKNAPQKREMSAKPWYQRLIFRRR